MPAPVTAAPRPRRAGVPRTPASSGPRTGRYAPASARSLPAASRGSPSSSRNPLAAARRRIGAFSRGSVTLPESSPPRCRQELTSAPQESALAARSPTGCRPASQGAASQSSCSRPSPCMSVPPACSRALTPAAATHTAGSQDCCSPWQPRSACSHNWPSPSLPGRPRTPGRTPHRCPHACAPSSTSRRLTSRAHCCNPASAASCIRCRSAPSRRLAGTARGPHARWATVTGPQGVACVEVPPAGAGRVDQRQQHLHVAATALEADRRGQPAEPGQPGHHAEPGQTRRIVVADTVSQGGSAVGGQGQGGLQKIKMHPRGEIRGHPENRLNHCNTKRSVWQPEFLPGNQGDRNLAFGDTANFLQ